MRRSDVRFGHGKAGEDRLGRFRRITVVPVEAGEVAQVAVRSSGAESVCERLVEAGPVRSVVSRSGPSSLRSVVQVRLGLARKYRP